MIFCRKNISALLLGFIFLFGANLGSKETELSDENQSIIAPSPEGELPLPPQPTDQSEVSRRKYQILALNTETINLLRSNALARAQTNIERLKKLDPDCLEYHYLNGAYLYVIGRYPQSKKALLKAVEINPSHDPSYYLLGMIFVRRSKWESSVPYFQKAVELANYNPFYRLNMALAYFETGQYLKAKAEAEKGIELKPNYRNLKLILLKVNFLLGNKADALAQCKEFAKEGFVHREFAYIYARLTMDIDKNFRKAIKLYNQFPDLPFNEKRFLAHAYFHTSNYRASANVYSIISGSKILSEEDRINYLRSLVYIKDYRRLETFVASWMLEEPEKKLKIQEALDTAELLRENDPKVYHMLPSRSPYNN
ncbi:MULTISPECIES: tetratricopeptide repeat protein [unclassified Leptospira]|uniref:tetratricopeptide repeat protein n=1 Tax=unclassified Leptospira TaxID=2633828 RepID=UPI0002BE39F1|nr:MULTISPECIES: tetratricopeptide repeat protein [unclassified Leptospira]EMK00691.1 tetratricopeptide repeat protein [Leptospira sp. B5-022]MCR1793054.1 tetratricopeptide repeat protein [Leptospira sp. id769339]